jgi:hypothetical protein
MTPRIFTTTIVLASTLVLLGCGTSRPKGFICPAAAALVDAGSLTSLPPGATDPSSAAYRVEITHVGTACDYDPDKGEIDARLGITFTATRPPGGDSAQYTVPYFVGVSQEGTSVVDKKAYSVQFAFAPGQTSAEFRDRIESFILKPDADKKSTDYELLVGIQLTKDQLDFNRRVGRYAQ